MKLNIDANVIKSPINNDFVIADHIQLETDNLSITLNAMDFNVPINNVNIGAAPTFNYEGREKTGNWMAYWVNVKAKDLIELYPHVHARQPGMMRNQTPYDFQLMIGHGIEALKPFERDPSQPERRYVEVLAMEAGSEELAIRQVLSVLAGQLLTSHRYSAHTVSMIDVHVAEQLIQLGMTHFKSGDIKVNGALITSEGILQTERLWRLGNEGLGKLKLKQTLVVKQTSPHTRMTTMIPFDQHLVTNIDGKSSPTNNWMYNNSGYFAGQPGGINQMTQPGGHMFSDPNHGRMQMQPGHLFGQQNGFGQMGMGQLVVSDTLQRMASFSLTEQEADAAAREGKIDMMQHMTYIKALRDRNQAGEAGHPIRNDGMVMNMQNTGSAHYSQEVQQQAQFRGSPGDINSDLVKEASANKAMAYSFASTLDDVRNRSLSDSDLGPRNEEISLRGNVTHIEVWPVLVTEDEASVVKEDRCNAYGVYRHEEQGKIMAAVHVGDFLTGEEAVTYANKLGKFFGVPVEDYVSKAPTEAEE